MMPKLNFTEERLTLRTTTKIAQSKGKLLAMAGTNGRHPNIFSTELEVLGTEKDQLMKVLLKLDPKAATKNWSIEDFQDAVKRTKLEWETKDRIFGGKPQKFFHKIIGKFGAHRNLFKMIPQQTNYTSLVTGAATILVSVSKHLRTGYIH
jgi:hypothetical protein